MGKVISSASAKKVQLQQAGLMSDGVEPGVAQDMAQDETRLGGYAYQIISQQSQVISKLRSSVLADKDPENLHKMRIGTRRLAAAVLLFEDAVSITSAKGKTRSAAKLAKEIKNLTQTLGDVRDMDVMKQWFADALVNDRRKEDGHDAHSFSKKEKKTIRALLKAIKKRRKKKLATLTEALQGDRYKKLINQFKRWRKQPTFTALAQAKAAEAAALKIVEPIANLLQHPAWLMASRKVGDRGGGTHFVPVSSLTLEQLNQQLAQNGEQLHDLRKQIKNVRYQSEFFRGLYGIAYASQVREFRTLQKILGGLQDQIVVSQFLADEIGADWADKLPTIAAKFQSSRLALWQQWQPYQKKYLKLQGRASDSDQVA
ncbi:MAG: CHAD domain-containing protein [Phormidesmis sp.]